MEETKEKDGFWDSLSPELTSLLISDLFVNFYIKEYDDKSCFPKMETEISGILNEDIGPFTPDDYVIVKIKQFDITIKNPNLKISPKASFIISPEDPIIRVLGDYDGYKNIISEKDIMERYINNIKK